MTNGSNMSEPSIIYSNQILLHPIPKQISIYDEPYYNNIEYKIIGLYLNYRMYQQQYSQESHSKQQPKKPFSIRIEEPVKMYAPARNQFKLSNNPRYNQEATLNLQKMKNISKMLIDNKLTGITHIFQIKLLNTFDQAFRSLKEATEPHLQTYTVKQEIELTVDSFVTKINNIYKNQAAKSKCLFMIHMKILFGRGRSENSKRQMLRINSKLDRQTDQVDYFDKNISNEALSAQKTNKMLKKKKEQKEKEFTNFKQQMEQMLSYHESYLNKKN